MQDNRLHSLFFWVHTPAMRAGKSHAGTPVPRPVSTLAGALWEEFTTIHGKPRVDGEASGPDAALKSYFAAALRQKQAALCLSGGGIRSAAFSLGVLQALARHNLLGRFHYLSTVSGGGYIGGWLGAMLHCRNGDIAGSRKRAAREAGAARTGGAQELHQLSHAQSRNSVARYLGRHRPVGAQLPCELADLRSGPVRHGAGANRLCRADQGHRHRVQLAAAAGWAGVPRCRCLQRRASSSQPCPFRKRCAG